MKKLLIWLSTRDLADTFLLEYSDDHYAAMAEVWTGKGGLTLGKLRHSPESSGDLLLGPRRLASRDMTSSILADLICDRWRRGYDTVM